MLRYRDNPEIEYDEQQHEQQHEENESDHNDYSNRRRRRRYRRNSYNSLQNEIFYDEDTMLLIEEHHRQRRRRGSCSMRSFCWLSFMVLMILSVIGYIFYKYEDNKHPGEAVGAVEGLLSNSSQALNYWVQKNFGDKSEDNSDDNAGGLDFDTTTGTVMVDNDHEKKTQIPLGKHTTTIRYHPNAGLQSYNPFDFKNTPDDVVVPPLYPLVTSLEEDEDTNNSNDDNQRLGYLRQPHIVGSNIVFVSEGDLYYTQIDMNSNSNRDENEDELQQSKRQPSKGRVILPAMKLTTTVGNILHPKLHPTLPLVAFTATYTGHRELYLLDLRVATQQRRQKPALRLTYWDTSSGISSVVGWNAKTNAIYVSAVNRQIGLPDTRMYEIQLQQPSEQDQAQAQQQVLRILPIPLSQALNGAYDAEAGCWYFTRYRQSSNTIRYVGGTAESLWAFCEEEERAIPLTADYHGTSKNPQIVKLHIDEDGGGGHSHRYFLLFLSDRDTSNGKTPSTMNLFATPLPTKEDLYDGTFEMRSALALTHVSCQFHGLSLQEYSVTPSALRHIQYVVVLRIGADLYQWNDIVLALLQPGKLLRKPNLLNIVVYSDFHEHQERLLPMKMSKDITSLDVFETAFGSTSTMVGLRGQLFVAPVLENTSEGDDDDYGHLKVPDITTYSGAGMNLPPRRYRVAPGTMTGGMVRVLSAFCVPMPIEEGETTRRLAVVLATSPSTATAEHAFYLVEIHSDASPIFVDANTVAMQQPFTKVGSVNDGGLGSVYAKSVTLSPCGRRMAWTDTDGRICVMTLPFYQSTDSAFTTNSNTNSKSTPTPLMEYHVLSPTTQQGEPMIGTDETILSWSPGGRYLAIQHHAKNQFEVISIQDCGNPSEDLSLIVDNTNEVPDIVISENAITVTSARFNSFSPYWGKTAMDYAIESKKDKLKTLFERFKKDNSDESQTRENDINDIDMSSGATVLYFLSDRDIITEDVSSPWGSRAPQPHFPNSYTALYALPLVLPYSGADDSLYNGMAQGLYAGGGAAELWAQDIVDLAARVKNLKGDDDGSRRRRLDHETLLLATAVQHKQKVHRAPRDTMNREYNEYMKTYISSSNILYKSQRVLLDDISDNSETNDNSLNNYNGDDDPFKFDDDDTTMSNLAPSFSPAAAGRVPSAIQLGRTPPSSTESVIGRVPSHAQNGRLPSSSSSFGSATGRVPSHVQNGRVPPPSSGSATDRVPSYVQNGRVPSSSSSSSPGLATGTVPPPPFGTDMNRVPPSVQIRRSKTPSYDSPTNNELSDISLGGAPLSFGTDMGKLSPNAQIRRTIPPSQSFGTQTNSGPSDALLGREPSSFGVGADRLPQVMEAERTQAPSLSFRGSAGNGQLDASSGRTQPPLDGVIGNVPSDESIERGLPSNYPSNIQTKYPSSSPIQIQGKPSENPSTYPTTNPSTNPSTNPTGAPSSFPTAFSSVFPNDIEIDFSSITLQQQRSVRIVGVPPGPYKSILSQLSDDPSLLLVMKKKKDEYKIKAFTFSEFPSDRVVATDVFPDLKYVTSGLSTSRKHIFLIYGSNDIRVVESTIKSYTGLLEEKKLEKNMVDTKDWSISVWPSLEYEQMYHDAWRMLRDYFYDTEMHGVNWKAVHTRYHPLVRRCTKREELDDVLKQMAAELSALHVFVYDGEYNTPLQRSGTTLKKVHQVASLGASLERSAEYQGYIIRQIPQPDPEYNVVDGGDTILYSPLSSQVLSLSGQIGLKVGDVIVGINGESVWRVPDIHMMLRGQAGRTVRLEVIRKQSKTNDNQEDLFTSNDKNGGFGDNSSSTARFELEPVLCVPITAAAADNLRYAAWEYQTKLLAEQLASERGFTVGYIHLRSMRGPEAMDAFARNFFPNYDRQTLILDLRHNNGGNIDSWILDILQRKAWQYWESRSLNIRNGGLGWDQQFAFRGHLVVLIDEKTSSDGEGLSRGISELGLGRLVGIRSWGGGIWLSSDNKLVDGGIATAPEIGVYSENFGWGMGIEQMGIKPDIEVDNNPRTSFDNDKDEQLDRAIQVLADWLIKEPVVLPPMPGRKPDLSLDPRVESCPST